MEIIKDNKVVAQVIIWSKNITNDDKTHYVPLHKDLKGKKLIKFKNRDADSVYYCTGVAITEDYAIELHDNLRREHGVIQLLMKNEEGKWKDIF